MRASTAPIGHEFDAMTSRLSNMYNVVYKAYNCVPDCMELTVKHDVCYWDRDFGEFSLKPVASLAWRKVAWNRTLSE
ncbi:hypothetical protein NPIL_532261 [Nephila pilipes]|uniref:Uncharacterized protein n=1 Tax=Nephila pilipes TaxID=299642 RepID=A0A8X6UH28_NEPPI|nr:hypothetical protein NPIL_532261 [Nephila pilipes]